MSKEHTMTETEKLEEAVAVLRHMRANRAGTNNAAIAGERRALDTVIEALTAWNTRPSVVDEDAIILAMCRAHDREEAAQMGEPSPWREDFDSDPDWEQNRFLAMREAFDEARALLSASTVEG